MDSSEQRRKRKRIIITTTTTSSSSRPPPYYSSCASVRSLIFCFFFFFIALLYLSPYRRIISSPSSFHPVLVVSSLSLLSSSDSVRDYSRLSNLAPPPYKIEDRVLFPDHLLLMVSGPDRVVEGLDCVFYSENLLGNSSDSDELATVKRPVLSVDVYGFQWVVRCPLPPANYSAAAAELRRRGAAALDLLRHSDFNNRKVGSWENVAYAASLDGDAVAVFVKGLNLRPDRESDPTQLSCHFGLGNWESDSGRFVLTTKAVTAAQEVVRCLLPRSIRNNPDKAQGIRVTIGVTTPPHPHSRGKRPEQMLVPSVAKIFSSSTKSEGANRRMKTQMQKPKNGGKYELCVCTMLWNQASSLREWIMYHSWLGVERWFIYDNNSDDTIKDVIDELEGEDYNVTRHLWPWIKTQEAGFSHCALRARDECNWVSFVDVDEFFYFPFPTRQMLNRKSAKLALPGENSLRSLVSSFAPSVGEIRTACHSFGPSGLSSTPLQGVTVGYTCRMQSPERHKSIVRPDALDPTLLTVVHHFHLRKGFRYLNLHQSIAVINHYKYQVWEAFRAKFFRRVATYVADWQENQNEGSRDRAPGLGTEAIEPPNWRLQFCEVWDTGLRDFMLANLADPSTGLLPWERESATL